MDGIGLEADLRPECDADIVIDAVVEVHLVAGFGAEADGPEESFDAAAGIRREMRSGAAYTGDRIGEARTRDRSTVVHGEIDESDFAGDEDLEGAGRLELGTEESGNGADI